MTTICCIASYYKGAPLMEAAKAAGAHVILITNEKLKDQPWPMHAIDERFLVPDVNHQPDITHAVAFLARTRHIDRIIALDEYDTVTAAQIREHLRLPGLGESTGRHFRDKLAMRVRAQDEGVPVPAFCPVINHEDLRAFMARVPGPWLLKPRTEASAMGIRKIRSADSLWPILDELGDRQSYFLMEEFVPGDVFHVDSIVSDRTIRFRAVSRYGQPPLEVYQGGGVFVTQTVDPKSADFKALEKHNRDLLKAFGMVRGATHAEFIKSRADGKFRFLEVAARVGGAHIDLLVEHATGVNLWAEWARVEIADARKVPYEVKPDRALHTGLVVCLAKDEHVDLDRFNEPEVVWKLRKKHHAGLIVASPDAARTDALVARYTREFAQDFLAIAPPLENEKQMAGLE